MTGETSEAPRADATGFWHLARPAGATRTWLVAPDGRCVFLLGVNAVMRNTLDDRRRPRRDGNNDYIRRSDPATAARSEWARLSSGACGGIEAEHPYEFNSVGAFSEDNDFEDEPKTGHDSFVVRPLRQGGAGAPYAVVIHPEPGDNDRALKADGESEPLSSGFSGARIGDPYNPAFLADLDRLVASPRLTIAKEGASGPPAATTGRARRTRPSPPTRQTSATAPTTCWRAAQTQASISSR